MTTVNITLTFCLNNIELMSWTHDSEFGACSVWRITGKNNVNSRLFCQTFTGKGHEVTLNIVKIGNIGTITEENNKP